MKRYEPPAGWTVQAYKFALDPDPADTQNLRRHAGAARFAFNHMLGRLNAVKAQRQAEASYGVAEADLTPWQGWSLPDLRRTWNHIKQWVTPWWAECSKEAFNTGPGQPRPGVGQLGRLTQRQAQWPQDALAPVQGQDRRPLRPVHHRRDPGGPRPAARGAAPTRPDPHSRVDPQTVAPRQRGHRDNLVRDGHRDRRTLVVLLPGHRETGHPTAAHAPRLGKVVGVDAGVNHLAVLSTGEMMDNPAPFKAALKRLGKAQRRACRRNGPYDPATKRRRPASNRWKRAQAQMARIHATVAAVRADSWHQLTTGLAQQYDTVVVENLHVAGMVRNHRLARALSDAAPATLRRQLQYKTGWYGTALHIADRCYPNSKTRSGCKTVKPKLSLSQRMFNREARGLSLHPGH
jgi:putative transposase